MILEIWNNKILFNYSILFELLEHTLHTGKLSNQTVAHEYVDLIYKCNKLFLYFSCLQIEL